MAIKKIQLKNMTGDELLPKTLGELVWNGTGASAYNLSTVEEGAQVNTIEQIKVNGTALTPDANKAVNVVIPAASEYTIEKKQTAETGYAASYYLTKDGTKVGEYINIPKDMVVESGTVKTCTTADVPVEGYKVGDKYIDLVIANASSSHLYILVSDLIDVYEGSTYIDVSNNTISLKYNDLVTALGDSFYTESEVDALLAPIAQNASDAVDAAQAAQDDLDAYKTTNDAAVASKAEDDEVVHLTGAETIAGVKTFSSSPIAPTPASSSNDTTVATTAFVKSAIAGGDAGVVHTTGDESIAGTKTFTGAIAATAATVTVATQTAGDNSTKAASTAFVKDAVDTSYNSLNTAKADKATTLAGYGITDSIVYEEIVSA